MLLGMGINLLGGLCLFLFAILEMNRHITAIAGNRIKGILLKVTKNPLRGYLAGLGITLLNQSSSATTVMEAALVGMGYLTFRQSIAVTLGAELGATLLPQLVAFPGFTRLFPLFLLSGLVLSGTARRKRYRHIGFSLFAFGLLFLGLEVMMSSVAPLKDSETFRIILRDMDSPLAGIAGGLLFTMVIQSANATVGLTIAMAMADTMTLEQAVPITMGAAIGTCITAVLGSVTLNREAKRSAYIHIVFQSFAVLWVYLLIRIPYDGDSLYYRLLRSLSSFLFHSTNTARLIALSYTLQPLINLILLLPLMKFILPLFDYIIPPRESPERIGVHFLDESLIGRNNSLSLEMVRREIQGVTGMVGRMAQELEDIFHDWNRIHLDRTGELYGRVESLNGEIIRFLARLSQEELSRRESSACMNYIYIQHGLSSIGDILDKNIGALISKQIDLGLSFSGEGYGELEGLIERIVQNMESLGRAVAEGDRAALESLHREYRRGEEEAFKQSHIERLHRGMAESIATSAVHLDLITHLSRINGHIHRITGRFIHTP